MGESEVPKIGITLVNFNNYEDTSECLDSLLNITYDNTEIVVVDNGSTDQSADRIESEYDCHIVRNSQNLGFAKANNIGIEMLLKEGADHVLLMNNDIVVTKSFLERIVSVANSKQKVAGVGCLILEHESQKVWSAGGKHIPYLATVRNIEHPVRNKPYETNFISPALLLLTDQFLSQGYRLDDSYFFSVEDQQLAYDAQENGWKFLITPQSVVYHKGGATAGSENPFRYYHYTWGRLNFASKNLHNIPLIVFILFFIASRILRFIQWLLCGERKLIHATILAINDYFRSNDIKRPTDF